MSELNEFRKKIDEIDNNIIELLLSRFTVVKDVAEYKKERGLEIFQKDREAEILAKIADKTDNEYILEIYKTILQTSKSSQKI